MVLEARSLNSKCQHGWFLLEALREELFHASIGSGGCWWSWAFFGLETLTPAFASVFM